jgi:hypothetical protein
LFVKVLISSSVATLVAASILAGTVLADPTTNERKQKVEERAIFITGSLIPQRVKLQPIGTTTVSPIRFIDRREIDQAGRRTTPGAFVNDPSVRIIDHYSPAAQLVTANWDFQFETLPPGPHAFSLATLAGGASIGCCPLALRDSFRTGKSWASNCSDSFVVPCSSRFKVWMHPNW